VKNYLLLLFLLYASLVEKIRINYLPLTITLLFFIGETLSTLLFATRCMSVKTVPVQHAEVDYAEMCAALQAKVRWWRLFLVVLLFVGQ